MSTNEDRGPMLWLSRDAFAECSYEIWDHEPTWDDERRTYVGKPGGHRICMMSDAQAEQVFGVRLRPGQRLRVRFETISSAVTDSRKTAKA